MEMVEGAWKAVDMRVTQLVWSLLRNVMGVELTGTPTTKGLPLIDSPTPIVVAITIYLSCVIGGLLWIKAFNLKPRAQEPALLQALVLLHNFFCFGLSLYMCIGIIYQAILNRYTLWGNSYKLEQTEMAILVYMFYMSKYVEFMDTIIMVLKRNTRQITFLHVYHHSSIALIWWIIAYHAPGGEGRTDCCNGSTLCRQVVNDIPPDLISKLWIFAAYFSAALNSGVHVFMYLYYFLAAVLRGNEKVRRKYLFWGRYLTQLQMFQFGLNLLQAYYDRKVHAPYPPFLITILFYYMISLLVLFANFYVHKYVMSSPKGKQKTSKAE